MAVVEYAPVEVLTEREQRARTLEAAALEIEVHGWCRNSAQDEEGRFCAAGAIAHVLGWRGRNDSTKTLWLETFGGAAQRNAFMISSWNDHRARSAEDVTFLLRWRAEEIRDGWDA